ncbi:2-C-methyl-D-erythritol 4-phosphate cytidylyltransferase [Natronocella acetinitrilica]|uniref:2-C-methyl-D-erythritol 4-phosphate cytidylyltransferase n=1 Tax=Natronocella acetinitrilica TaxID=414046 RepID=A0AAE3G5D8_9GAMM|nr:2-C-methyl-D-erythritol 4-phosphate cytidylyltransferase [Natronocella acetinitrilica]MCP1676171.1 2-C-methyl-D-erythritol 4-phosphate cytidylyltransferase [Natronocella acetinitrilica]
MTHADHVYAVVPAAGVGRRMGGPTPKQYLSLDGSPVIRWSLDALLVHPEVRGAVVAISPDDDWWSALNLGFDKPVDVVQGGAERAQSVLNALNWLHDLPTPPSWVLVHDAVRPCVSPDELTRLLAVARAADDGGLLASPVRDTLKRQNPGVERVSSTVDRTGLWHALTPQCFPLVRLRAALQEALGAGQQVTDEAQAMELAGYRPALVEGSRLNIKLTYPADLSLVECILQAQRDDSNT